MNGRIGCAAQLFLSAAYSDDIFVWQKYFITVKILVKGCMLIGYPNSDSFILVKPLSNGDYAIGYFNMGDTATMVGLEFWDIGLPATVGRGLDFYDCIEHNDLGVKKESFAQCPCSR